MTGHWTEDDFIARLYGVGQPDAHLDECGACREAWKGFQARREFVRAGEEAEIPAEVLMAQRRAIHRRMDREPRPAVKRVVPILAAAGMLAMGLLLVRSAAVSPRPQDHVTVVESPASDEKFFQEVAAIAQSVEPRAAKPIEALFEE
jgi:predicted anti-sigma-YlaC factor YlaD